MDNQSVYRESPGYEKTNEIDTKEIEEFARAVTGPRAILKAIHGICFPIMMGTYAFIRVIETAFQPTVENGIFAFLSIGAAYYIYKYRSSSFVICLILAFRWALSSFFSLLFHPTLENLIYFVLLTALTAIWLKRCYLCGFPLSLDLLRNQF